MSALDPPDPAPPAAEAATGREQVRAAEILGCVPLLEAYFRWANVQMPTALRAIFEANRLTARHGSVLAQLTVDESLGVGELARRIGVSLSTASQLVSDLHRAGLVERHEDRANRRRILVSIAAEHRRNVEELVANRAAPLLRVLDSLTPRDKEGFAAGLTAWAREVRSW